MEEEEDEEDDDRVERAPRREGGMLEDKVESARVNDCTLKFEDVD